MGVNKIPRKQLKLILVLATLLLLACSYFFGFNKFNRMADDLKKENKTLLAHKNELLEKSLKREAMIDEINSMRDEYEALLHTFPSGLSQDKSIIFIYNLAGNSNMKIKSIGLSEGEIFYSPSGASMQNAGSVNAPDTVQAVDGEDMLGYKTKVIISYSSTYEGLKKCIGYINDYKDRMSIESFNAAFDQANGLLSGTMVISLYALSGTDRPAEDVIIDSVPIGTENIFGTFESPADLNIIQEGP